MGFLFRKKISTDDALRQRVHNLAQMMGAALNVATCELSARRRFEAITMLPRRVHFGSKTETFDGPHATCTLQSIRLVVEARDEELSLQVSVELDEENGRFFVGEDFQLSGSSAQAFADGLRSGIGLPPLASRLELPGLEALVEKAERAMWTRTGKLSGLYTFSNQDTGLAVVSDGPREVMRCTFTTLGSWSSASESWLWAWANPSVDRKHSEKLDAVRAAGSNALTMARVPAPFPQDGRRLAAVAAEIIRADAVAVLALTPTSVFYEALFELEN